MIAPVEPPPTLFGHSFKDGEIQWQFKVTRKGDITSDICLFSWLTGLPTETITVENSFLDECTLYRSKAEWLAVGDAA